MKVLTLLIIAAVSMACMSPQRQPSASNISHIVEAVTGKTSKELMAAKWEAMYPEMFLKSSKDFMVCPENLEHIGKTNGKVLQGKVIDGNNRNFGHKYNLKFYGKPIKSKWNPLAKAKSRYLEYDILVIHSKDEFLEKEYPNTEVNCVNCEKGADSQGPIMLIQSNGEPKVSLFLTKVEQLGLTFSSGSESILLRRHMDGCPE